MNPKLEKLRVAVIPPSMKLGIDQSSTVEEILECPKTKLYPVTDYLQAQNDEELTDHWSFLIDIETKENWTGCNIEGIHQALTKKETRVYVVKIDEFDMDTEVAYPGADGFDEEKFIMYAEEEGRVYTLKGFQEAFNAENISDVCDFILFKEVIVHE